MIYYRQPENHGLKPLKVKTLSVQDQDFKDRDQDRSKCVSRLLENET